MKGRQRVQAEAAAGARPKEGAERLEGEAGRGVLTSVGTILKASRSIVG